MMAIVPQSPTRLEFVYQPLHLVVEDIAKRVSRADDCDVVVGVVVD
jgi:hypothetical protein